MSKPLEQIIKDYPARGPIKQYRFIRAISFTCIRCKHIKTAKLITICYNDWSKRLCNGCYGRLLSIYEIQAGQQKVDEKVEQLSEILLKLIDKNIVRQQTERILLKSNHASNLSPVSLKFFATSECVANTLLNERDLDWSPAIIGLCKAFELEILNRLIEPLKSFSKGKTFSENEMKDKDYGRIVSYCCGRQAKPPELGVIRHFLMTVINSTTRIESSIFLKEIVREFIIRVPKSEWLIDKDGLAASIEELTSRFRNKAAHTDELINSDYDECKEFVFGNSGIMWKLIISTKLFK